MNHQNHPCPIPRDPFSQEVGNFVLANVARYDHGLPALEEARLWLHEYAAENGYRDYGSLVEEFFDETLSGKLTELYLKDPEKADRLWLRKEPLSILSFARAIIDARNSREYRNYR